MRTNEELENECERQNTLIMDLADRLYKLEQEICKLQDLHGLFERG